MSGRASCGAIAGVISDRNARPIALSCMTNLGTIISGGARSGSFGAAAIAALAIISTAVLAAVPVQPRSGVQMWTFARLHKQLYEPIIASWPAASRPDITLMSFPALERRIR